MAWSEKVDKNCVDCGVLLVQVCPARKLCYDCAKKRNDANRKKSKRANAEKENGGIIRTPITNPNAKYCKGCAYWGGDYENTACCNYIFIEGHSRPCPPGKDCTEKVIGNRYRLAKFIDI